MYQATRSRRAAKLDRCVAAVALIAGFGLASFGPIGVAHAAATPPDGIWYDKDQSAIIKFHPCTDAAPNYCGTIVWLKDPTEADGSPKVDTLNKDPAKKGKPMIGLDVFTKMVEDDDHWKGKAYNAEDGKTYDVTFAVKTPNNDVADVRGCLLGFLCRTEQFKRAAQVPGGDPTASLDTASTKKKHAKKETARQ